MLGYHRKPQTQDEAVRWVWYHHSEWGRQRRQKLFAIGCFVGAVAVTIIAGLLLR